ncbi:MAG: hypothetical protein DRR06_14615 [Gammaproteobacteria bacterium]|nr:MAG: hypothetical protein DRR06_14615 [Gammaproteobacteria bacterium]
MIIAIDARPLSRPLTGIGRYTYNLIKQLVELDSRHVWHLYSDQPLAAHIPKLPNIHVKTGNVKSDIVSTLFAQAIFSVWARKDNIDVFWSPRHHLPLLLPRKVKKIVTIHDIVWYRHPETMPTSRKWLERLLMPPSLAASDHIIAVSDFTKHELSNALGIRADKVTVTTLAPTPLPTPKTSNFPPEHIKKPFYLFVGTLEPRKNLGNLLTAFSEFSLENPDINLVIAGKDGWGKVSVADISEDLGIRDKVAILGFVSDETLHTLYKNCSALLMPSIYEGFGLPAIEALYYCKPVIATTNSAITPALSPLVINTTDHSAQAILQAMNRLKKTPPQAAPGLNIHTWADCAALTMDVLTMDVLTLDV